MILFLFERRTERGTFLPLRVVAWDLEDVGHDGPSDQGVDDPLMFFAQGLFDERIHAHPALYPRYSDTVRRLLDTDLSFERVSSTLRRVQALRDGLDDGRPVEIQADARQARDDFVTAMLDRLRRRADTLAVELAKSQE